MRNNRNGAFRVLASAWLLALTTVGGPRLWGQQYVVSTFAGGAPPATPVSALSAYFGSPGGVAVDKGGNIYFSSLNSVFKVDSSETLTRVAGNSRRGYSGDGGSAVAAQLDTPEGLAVDAAGNIYIADIGNQRVRKVSVDGTITTVAGDGNTGYSGDDGPAVAARLSLGGTARWGGDGIGLATDAAGNLYIADARNNRVRKVSSTGIITTVAGNGTDGLSGDGGPATSAQLSGPVNVAVDAAGDLFIADAGNSLIRKVSPSGIITSLAGVHSPEGLAVDFGGTLYIASSDYDKVFYIATNGTGGVYAGNGDTGYSGDGGRATAAQLNWPVGLAADGRGNLFIADFGNDRIRAVSPGAVISTVANGNSGSRGDGGPASASQLNHPNRVAVDASGNVYFPDGSTIRKVSASGTITTFAGTGTAGYSGDGGPALSAQLSDPAGVAVDNSGNIYVADSGNNRVRRISPTGVITTFAGTGTATFSGDGGPATNADLQTPRGVAVDASGNLYIADKYNDRIRKVAGGTITTVAGGGNRTSYTYTGDNGPAKSAYLNHPESVAVDAAGNLFIVDSGHSCIRKVSSSGTITTVAGGGSEGRGDGGLATNADLSIYGGIYSPDSGGLAVDAAGSLYVGDTYCNCIRKVTPDGIINTIAGNGLDGYSGDGGTATNARFSWPDGVAVDAAGNVYVADVNNSAIRVLRPVTAPPLPGITVGGMTNAASSLPGGMAPNEYITIWGEGLGPASGGYAGPMATVAAGTTVYIGGIPAPILYASAKQINALVPFGVAGRGATTVQVEYNGVQGNVISVPVVDSSPGIFTQGYGPGQAWVLNQDSTFNSASNPAARNTYIAFWATGQGMVDVEMQDGVQVEGPPFPNPVLPVSVSIGGAKVPDANVAFKGLVYTGEIQLNVLIPATAATGDAVSLVLTIGGTTSRSGVTVAIK